MPENKTTTNIKTLIINRLTRAQYATSSKDDKQLWILTDVLDPKLDLNEFTPESKYVGQITQHEGETNENYIKGYFYECIKTSEEGVEPETYGWKKLNVQPETILEWGNIGGNLEDQTDLASALGARILHFAVMPDENLEELENQIVQYYGPVIPGSDFVPGYFYKCVDTGTEEEPVYEWQQVNVQPATPLIWGNIGGNLEDQTDLKDALDAKVAHYTTLPTASADYANEIVQYIGTTTVNYKEGFFYKCVKTSEEGVEPETYSWIEKNVQHEDAMKVHNWTSGAETNVAQYVVNELTLEKYAELEAQGLIDPNQTWIITDAVGYQTDLTDETYVADAKYEGKITQHSGTTTADFIEGRFYKCIKTSEEGVEPATYEWHQIDVQTAATWGSITGTLSDQSDLNTALSEKLDKKPDGTHDLIDENNKVAVEYIPDWIVGQLLYAGNVSYEEGVATAELSSAAKARLGTEDDEIVLTNDETPITGYKANEGNYYISTNDGSFAGVDFLTGDWLISTGEKWTKVTNTDAVTGVKGSKETSYRIGNVSISAENVGAIPQYDTLPSVSADIEGLIVQYTGETSGSLVNGYFYKCVEDSETPDTYKWEVVSVSPTDLPDQTGMAGKFLTTDGTTASWDDPKPITWVTYEDAE